MKTNPMRNQILGNTVGLLMVAALLAVGCDDKGATSDAPANAQQAAAKDAPAAKPVDEVRLGYFANLTHAQGVLGAASGDFAKAVAPAKFSTKVFNAGPSVIEAIFAGEIDIAYIGPQPALTGFVKSRGERVRVIAGAAANGVVIVARKDSGITKLSDLIGRKVATPQHANTQDIAARHYLVHDLKQKDHSNVVPIPNAEQAAMMDRKEIDAAWAPEPWGSFLVSQVGATVIEKEEKLWPEGKFAIAVVITTPEFLAKHPDVVEKILRVHRDWTAKLQKDPKTYVPQLGDALYALTQKRLPPGVLDAAFANTSFTDDPQEHTFKTFAQWSYDLGFAKDVAKTDGLIDTAILRKLQGESPPAK